MKTLFAAIVSVLALASQAHADGGRIEIKATGRAYAPADVDANADDADGQEILRQQATARAMINARLQAESIAKSGGVTLGAVTRVEVLSDAQPSKVRLTNADMRVDDEDDDLALDRVGYQLARAPATPSVEVTLDIVFSTAGADQGN